MVKVKAMFIREIFFLFSIFQINNGFLTDITFNVFGKYSTGAIAAYGDFNSDKLTDVFVLTDEGTKLEIYFAYNESPFLRLSQINCSLRNGFITSVVPGDFNGDSRMDVLVTLQKETKNGFKIFWGSGNTLNCTEEDEFIDLIDGQPLILDFNGDKLPDILGENENKIRNVWISSIQGTFTIVNISSGTNTAFKKPHSHSSVDLNKDLMSDVVLTTDIGYEIWHREKGVLNFKENLSYVNPIDTSIIGQTVFTDIDLDGVINHVLPVCYDRDCLNSTILIRKNNKWIAIGGNFVFNSSNWSFIPPENRLKFYDDTISLRVGDYDLDGYPDFLTVLKSNSNKNLRKAFLIRNVPCEACHFKRKFELVADLDGLNSINNVQLATFYDVYNDGILDILLVLYSSKDSTWSLVAFQNNYASNSCFMKIIVLSGLCYTDCHVEKVPYGVNQPGPTVCYEITISDGNLISGCAGQLSQSAHFALQLPYVVFGLGHTPNFVDRLKVGVAENDDSHKLFHEWTNLIPNSQMFVIPNLISDHNRWINKLFVTPSHQVLITFAALCGVMGLMLLVILGLHIKEKREDKREKLKESHRFHFDAM